MVQTQGCFDGLCGVKRLRITQSTEFCDDPLKVGFEVLYIVAKIFKHPRRGGILPEHGLPAVVNGLNLFKDGDFCADLLTGIGVGVGGCFRPLAAIGCTCFATSLDILIELDLHIPEQLFRFPVGPVYGGLRCGTGSLFALRIENQPPLIKIFVGCIPGSLFCAAFHVGIHGGDGVFYRIHLLIRSAVLSCRALRGPPYNRNSVSKRLIPAFLVYSGVRVISNRVVEEFVHRLADNLLCSFLRIAIIKKPLELFLELLCKTIATNNALCALCHAIGAGYGKGGGVDNLRQETHHVAHRPSGVAEGLDKALPCGLQEERRTMKGVESLFLDILQESVRVAHLLVETPDVIHAISEDK